MAPESEAAMYTVFDWIAKRIHWIVARDEFEAGEKAEELLGHSKIIVIGETSC